MAPKHARPRNGETIADLLIPVAEWGRARGLVPLGAALIASARARQVRTERLTAVTRRRRPAAVPAAAEHIAGQTNGRIMPIVVTSGSAAGASGAPPGR